MKILNLVVLLLISKQGFCANVDALANYLLESSLKKEFYSQVKKKSFEELGEAGMSEVCNKLDYSNNIKFIEATKKFILKISFDEDGVDDIEFDEAWPSLREFIQYYSKRKVKNILTNRDFRDASICYTLAEMLEDLVCEINSVRDDHGFHNYTEKLGVKFKRYLSDEHIADLTEKIPH
ncbi:MAG: hypothetical protein AB8G05_15555 [Oligoflexales bacterium]